MDDKQMRQKIDQALGALEQRLRMRGRVKTAAAGATAGLMMALDACVKIVDPQPVYGVQVDATQQDGARDASGSDLVVLYGIQDAGPTDLSMGEMSTLYGVMTDATFDAGPAPDVDLGEMGVLYGVMTDATVQDVDLGEMSVLYGIQQPDGGDEDANVEDAETTEDAS
ncbi:MAG: hypothetical protein ABIJ09_16565 [Pseudomonadota bacterium]